MSAPAPLKAPLVAIPVGARVRFTEAALALMSGQRQLAGRFSGRIGEVTGYRMGASDPTVSFPADGRKKAQKLFEVSVKELERVA